MPALGSRYSNNLWSIRCSVMTPIRGTWRRSTNRLTHHDLGAAPLADPERLGADVPTELLA